MNRTFGNFAATTSTGLLNEDPSATTTELRAASVCKPWIWAWASTTLSTIEVSSALPPSATAALTGQSVLREPAVIARCRCDEADRCCRAGVPRCAGTAAARGQCEPHDGAACCDGNSRTHGDPFNGPGARDDGR